MQNFKVDLGDACYETIIEDGLLKKLDELLDSYNLNGNVYIICDELIAKKYNVKNLLSGYGENYSLYIVPGQKNNKTFYSAMKIFEDLDNKNISRDSTIVAIGGGVIGDMSAYIAACWYRGVSLVHVPTTLLSAVDSCLGGKAALNFRNTVNAIGLYYHPSLIIIDTELIKELPAREISSGFGEIIKYSFISKNEIFDEISNLKKGELSTLDRIITLCLKQKIEFVNGDIKEAGDRLFLNFGHTIGHAIEFSTIYEGEEMYRHGEGVGLGMIAIFHICIKLGYLTNGDLTILLNLLDKYNLPTHVSASSLGLTRNQLIDRVVKIAFKDKKRTSAGLRLILLNGKGNPIIYNTTDPELIRSGVKEIVV